MSKYKDVFKMTKPSDFVLDEICKVASVSERAITIGKLELSSAEALTLSVWLIEASEYLQGHQK